MMAPWAITSFKTLIPTVLECPCDGTRLACDLFLHAQPILLNKFQQVLGKRRDGSNPSGDTGHSQGSWECGNTTTNAGQGPVQKQPCLCHQDVISSRKARRSLSHTNMGGDKQETGVLLRRCTVIPEKQCKGCKTLFSVKPLTYPKSTADFHSTNTNTGTCRQSTVQSSLSETKATWLTAGGNPHKSLSNLPHKHTSYSDCNAVAPPLSILYPFAWPGRFNTYLAQATGPETEPC